MEKDDFTTKVIFRKWRTKPYGIIALFPEIPSDLYGAHCLSYEHVGEHGGASYEYVIWQTRLATPWEFDDLKKELESLGYVLEVRRRCTPEMREARFAEAKRIREFKEAR